MENKQSTNLKQVKSAYLQIYFTPEEKELLKQVSQQLGITMSGYIKGITILKARQQISSLKQLKGDSQEV